MPYTTPNGSFELASRLGHREIALRAVADRREFFVPAESVPDRGWLRDRICVPATDLVFDGEPLASALAVDGSRDAERVRDGMPSVVYGFAQASAAYLDLTAMEAQKSERFVDPYRLNQALNTALVSIDLPCAGAYERQGIGIQRSWREAIDRILRERRIEVNGLNRTLLDLLMLLHGAPGRPAASVSVNCPDPECSGGASVGVDAPAPMGAPCATCGEPVFVGDILRIHEEVHEEGTNETALGRLMSVLELLTLIGLLSLLWEQHRAELLPSILFIQDGPLAMYGTPAKLRGRALDFYQAMSASTPGAAPFVAGVEKTGAVVDFAHALARNDVLLPGELLTLDAEVIARLGNTDDPRKYGKETYWGRKFIYRCTDGRVLVPTVPPPTGAPYDTKGGQPDPRDYPTLPYILDVFERTGSSMYVDGIIPVALAHGTAALPIGVGTDVLKLVAKRKLGLGGTQ
jgi:hypothetical protein